MQFLIGTGKSQIICFKKNIGMMGYGMSANTVQDASTEISARSLWIEDNSKNVFIYTCAEICFVTPAIRREVLSRITSELDSDFDPAYLMLSAQHTHSAPGGYSEYALYNFTIPGFHQEVFDGIVNGIFESIKQAHSSVEPGTMDLVEHRIESEPAIAWNRSLDAYNANPENAEVCKEDAHLAIDNRMRMLRVFRNEIACGQVNWFGVHATCIGKTNHLVSSDNAPSYTRIHMCIKTGTLRTARCMGKRYTRMTFDIMWMRCGSILRLILTSLLIKCLNTYNRIVLYATWS